MKKIYLLLSCLLSSSALATTLPEALAHTYQNNPDLIAAREELKKTDEAMYKAISGFLPKLDYEAKQSNAKYDTYGGIKQDTWINYKYKHSNLALEHNLFNGGRDVLSIKMAKYTIESGKATLISKEQDILFKAIGIYLDIIYDQLKVDINKENVQAYQKKYKSIEDKFNAGFVREADLANALSRKSDAETNLIDALGKQSSDLATYNQIIGLEAENLKLESNLSEVPANQAELLNNSLKNNPELKKTLFKEKAANLTVKYNAAALLPNVDLGGKLIKQWDTNSLKTGIPPYTNKKEIYVSVKVPLYNRGVEYSNTRYSKADAAKSKYDLKNIKSLTTQKATQAWNEYLTAKEMVKSSQDSVKAGTLALAGKQREYEEGQISLTELLELQENIFKYKLKLAEVTKNLEFKIYNMAYVMGKLTAKDLKLPTGIYNASENYDKVKIKLIGF